MLPFSLKKLNVRKGTHASHCDNYMLMPIGVQYKPKVRLLTLQCTFVLLSYLCVMSSTDKYKNTGI